MSATAARAWLWAQASYYAVTGAWAVAAFPHFRAFVSLPVNAFQATAFAAVLLPVAAALAVAAARGAPLRYAAGLGAGVALGLAATEAAWLPRFAGTRLWLDLPVELLFAAALGRAAWGGVRERPGARKPV